mgnify:FL=1
MSRECLSSSFGNYEISSSLLSWNGLRLSSGEGIRTLQTCALQNEGPEIDHEAATDCLLEEIPPGLHEQALPTIQIYRECLERFQLYELLKGTVTMEACRCRL